ncbi:MAG TPA: hypothetical protein VKE98_18895 [Gemmataceae bacterium]|nr:hypothetical protein [Gemmataceae bacterium]
MRRLRLLIVLFIPFGLTLRAADSPNKLGNVYVVAIGQENGWKFLPEGFERVVREQTKGLYNGFHSKVLTGEHATRKELLEGVSWMCENAKAGDLVMLFIACHGSCNAKGESVFATRAGQVRPRDIKSLLAKIPCHAIVVNDACCSGNWPKELEGDPMPPNVTALCCCLSTQVSGIEFDIALFEALYGKADYNKDGIVDLDETIKYCAARIREVQGGKLTPVLHKAKNLKGPVPLTKVNPNMVSVVKGREVYSAFVEKKDGENYEVRVIGFNDHPGPFHITRKYTRDNVILPKDGTPLMVRKENGWHPAVLLQSKGDDYMVRYVAKDAGQEGVPGERIRHLFAVKPNEDIPKGLFRSK